MSSAYQSRPFERRTSTDADQIELAAIRGTSSVVEEAATDELVSGELEDAAEIEAKNQGQNPWQQKDLVQDELVGDASEEVQRRLSLLGPAYPFSLAKNKLTYVRSATGVYEFCLSICGAPTITAGDYVRLPRAFERLVAGLVREYFGTHQSALHTGWPRTPGTNFRTGLEPLSRFMSEWVWSPEDGMPDDGGDAKDETLDFVVAANFFDNRPGCLYVLGQCACGNDWDTKLSEPNLEQLRKWFRPPWLTPPVKAFTTPFLLGDEWLREAARRSQSFILDRGRLALIAEGLLNKSTKRGLRRRLESLSYLVLSQY